MKRQPAWYDLARHALHEAVREDYDHAASAVTRIGAEHGDKVISEVMCAWIDATACFCGYPHTTGTVAVQWQDTGTGVIRSADEVAPADRWAGRLFAARMALDSTQYAALINSISSDEEWSINVAAVLRTCATQLRERGYRPPTHSGETN